MRVSTLDRTLLPLTALCSKLGEEFRPQAAALLPSLLLLPLSAELAAALADAALHAAAVLKAVDARGDVGRAAAFALEASFVAPEAARCRRARTAPTPPG